MKASPSRTRNSRLWSLRAVSRGRTSRTPVSRSPGMGPLHLTGPRGRKRTETHPCPGLKPGHGDPSLLQQAASLNAGMFAAPPSLLLSVFSKKHIYRKYADRRERGILGLFAVQGTGPRSAQSEPRRSGILVMRIKVLARKNKK